MDLLSKMSMLYDDHEVGRIKSVYFDDSMQCFTVDVHGMKCKNAKKFINNLICLAIKPAKMTVIHGYIHGTAILEMLHNNFENSHVLKCVRDIRNMGVTYLILE